MAVWNIKDEFEDKHNTLLCWLIEILITILTNQADGEFQGCRSPLLADWAH